MIRNCVFLMIFGLFFNSCSLLDESINSFNDELYYSPDQYTKEEQKDIVEYQQYLEENQLENDTLVLNNNYQNNYFHNYGSRFNSFNSLYFSHYHFYDTFRYSNYFFPFSLGFHYNYNNYPFWHIDHYYNFGYHPPYWYNNWWGYNYFNGYNYFPNYVINSNENIFYGVRENNLNRRPSNLSNNFLNKPYRFDDNINYKKPISSKQNNNSINNIYNQDNLNLNRKPNYRKPNYNKPANNKPANNKPTNNKPNYIEKPAQINNNNRNNNYRYNNTKPLNNNNRNNNFNRQINNRKKPRLK